MTDATLSQLPTAERSGDFFNRVSKWSGFLGLDRDSKDVARTEKDFVLAMLDRNPSACRHPSDLSFIARRYRG
jgi:hypothetical protein